MKAKGKAIIQTLEKILSGGNIELLTKAAYGHLTGYCGFIAHYDLDGFKIYYGESRGFLRFVEELYENLWWQKKHVISLYLHEADYGDMTAHDVNSSLLDFLERNLSEIRERASRAARTDRIEKLKAEIASLRLSEAEAKALIQTIEKKKKTGDGNL